MTLETRTARAKLPSYRRRAQALFDKNTSYMTWLTPEEWDSLLAKLRIPERRW